MDGQANGKYTEKSKHTYNWELMIINDFKIDGLVNIAQGLEVASRSTGSLLFGMSFENSENGSQTARKCELSVAKKCPREQGRQCRRTGLCMTESECLSSLAAPSFWPCYRMKMAGHEAVGSHRTGPKWRNNDKFNLMFNLMYCGITYIG